MGLLQTRPGTCSAETLQMQAYGGVERNTAEIHVEASAGVRNGWLQDPLSSIGSETCDEVENHGSSFGAGASVETAARDTPSSVTETLMTTMDYRLQLERYLPTSQKVIMSNPFLPYIRIW